MRTACAKALLLVCLIAATLDGRLARRPLADTKDIAKAQFISCPGCKLNRLPELKRFLREVIEKGDYPRANVTFIPGRAPELYLYDANDVEIEKVYVDHLSFAELHTLMEAKGFKQKAAGGTRLLFGNMHTTA